MSTNGLFLPAYPLSAIKQSAFKWFDIGDRLSKCPYISDAGNYGERLTRLKWLSEGSLGHHMKGGQSHSPDPWELALFRRFIASGPELKAPWKPWCVQHNAGWCVVKYQRGSRVLPSIASVETHCGGRVWAHGPRRMKPTCPDCLGLKP